MRGIERAGGLVTRELHLLIDVVAPHNCDTGVFDGAPNWVNEVLKTDGGRAGLERALKYLGEL